MQSNAAEFWRELGRTEKAFIGLVLIYVALYFSGAAPAPQIWIALAAFFFGLVTFFRLVRRATRTMIWRLRNRLIVAYLFIAVVPVVLMLALLLGTSYAVVGQTAAYLAYTALNSRMRLLSLPAVAMSRGPSRDPQTALVRYEETLQGIFPGFEILSTGETSFRYPPTTALAAPPEPWKNASGLITKGTGAERRLYAWAHAERNANEVTILAPVTHELLTNLVRGLGDISFVDIVRRQRDSALPKPVNALDLHVRWLYPMYVPAWESPQAAPQRLLMAVDTRYSTVLGIVF